MIPSIIICSITCLTMIFGVLFFPTVRLGKIKLDTYWLVALLGAAVLLLTGQADVLRVGEALVSNDAINPIKILVLFISMTILSIFLDELGFFSHLANVTLKKAKTSQLKLFLYLYLTVSVLTVFTSNDVIILSFTPFICYFAKNAKISPMPYLAAEFVAANTWSMMLVIGNPTNIYLSSAYGINFLEYTSVMLLPTLAAGTVAFLCLFLLYRKKLSEPISGEPEETSIKDKPQLAVGLVHLGVCTLALAVGSYIGLEMWLVSMVAAISLFVFTLAFSLARKKRPAELFACLKRAPWQLIPFVLGMFIMVIGLSENGVTAAIAELLGESLSVWKYGLTSFLAANIINNIPMSVLFCSIIESLSEGLTVSAVFATVIGSNIGAFLTPIGALAGIMWSSILKSHNLKFGYLDFLKIGLTVAVPTILTALGVLWLVL
ncbi:MAG: hypothetical protein IKL79_06805 [Clostridia bacterium]|nr:hypothetical protein [Clostridia bacterium]